MTTSRPSQRTMFDDGPTQPMWFTPTVNDRPNEGSVRLLRSQVRAGTITEEEATAILGKSPWEPQGKLASSSPPATPASRSATPGSGPARTTAGTSGRGLLPLLKTSDPLGAFSRTLLATSAWGSTACCLTWNASATPAGRLLFRLRASALSTGGTGSGSSPDSETVWPTPNQADAVKGGMRHKGGNPTLRGATEGGLIGTPTAGPSQFARNSLPHSAAAANGQPGMKLNPEFVTALMGYPQFWMDDLPPDPLG